MSKTDKTNPDWVQLRQNRTIRKERHDHRNGACDLDIDDPTCYRWFIPGKVGRCTYSLKGNYSYRLKYYIWRGSWFKGYVKEYYGSERARVRMASHEVRKLTDYEDYEDFDFENRQHRHEAIWDAF